mmetsp:Transcript_66296/g.153971  ORF Transcript_66296/g.153971 Transcript_66296/m.153971 type:complete len:248 (-) Transcript_66296:254-997(-)
MVIPMGSMGPPMMGPPPAELWPRFKIIKYCILTLLICTLLRIMSGSFVPDVKIGGVIWNSVSIVLVAIFGIFLMKDDALLGQAHRFLATTCCQWCDQNCGGGMNCLLPFVIYSALNVILDLLFGVIGDVVKMVELFFNPSDWTTGLEGFWVGLNVISIISIYAAQITGAVQGWLAYRQAQDFGVTATPGDWSTGGGGSSGGGGQYYPGGPSQQAAARADRSDAPARESRPSQNFMPFSGGGQRLGSG